MKKKKFYDQKNFHVNLKIFKLPDYKKKSMNWRI